MSKVVLVTGCSNGGIGFHLCEQFAQRGCTVYATSRKLETMQGFEDEKIRTLAMDVTKDDEVQSVVQRILQDEGKIDVVVNNAGAIAIGPVAEATMEKVRNAFELNTFAALRVVNAASPSMMKRREGLIINIGSVVGTIPMPWNVLYSAAKAALHSITEGLAMELKPFGVNVMLVAAGAVKSNISKNQAATFNLASTSMYKDYEASMAEYMTLDANPHSMAEYMTSDANWHSMATDDFARCIVSEALSSRPPPYISIGGCASVFAFIQWLPRQYVLGFFAKKFMSKKDA